MRGAFRLAAVAILFCGSADAQLLDFYRVGGGAGCDFATIQAALAAAQSANGPSRILIARNRAYTAQALTIGDGHYVQLAGGFDDCLDNTPDGHTVIDGTGGTAASVIVVTGNGDVVLSNLEITGGDAGVGAGGGLKVLGNADVSLYSTQVHHNSAALGGGIYADAAPAQLAQRVFLGPGSWIHSNNATLGGGVYLTLSSFEGERSSIGFNQVSDSGGGVYASGNARVRLDRVPIGNNTAVRDGAGIYARGGASVMFFGAGPGTANISANRADRHGGGVYVLADEPGKTTRVDLWDASLGSNNLARIAGGGAYVREANPVANSAVARAYFTVNQVAPIGTAGPSQAELSSNVSGASFLNPTGPVFAIEADEGLAVMRVSRTRIAGNYGTTLFGLAGRSGPYGASVHIDDSTIYTNQAGSVAQSDLSRGIVLERVSLGGNEILGPALFDVDRVDLTLLSSILHQPGTVVLRGTANTSVFARHLLVHESGSLPPRIEIVQGDPRFVRIVPPDTIGYSDLHLQPASLAVDFAPNPFVDPAPRLDLDGRTRVVDRPDVVNVFGPLDLGAYESRPDELFRDGFETPPPSF